MIYPGNDFADMPVLGARLAQVTKPDDRVFVFGAEAEVLFYAQRVSATRYIFLFPLYGPYPDAREKQKAVADEITRHTPAAAFYLPNSLFYAPGSEQFFTHWSENYISQYFQVDSCLAVDSLGNIRAVIDLPHQKPADVNGLKVFATLDVRKDLNPPSK
jgi:hypothetical protein